MKFEHLIEINSANLPMAAMSREQLWAGLVLRAEKPEMSLVGLDQCVITERSNAGMSRELHFGQFVVRDRVSFHAMTSVVYDVEATENTGPSRLVMSIEEPDAGHLFVRFAYHRPLPPGSPAPDPFYLDHIKQAYYQADLDTVQTIRRLAHEGALDHPLQ